MFLYLKSISSWDVQRRVSGVFGYLCHMTSWIQFVICAHFGTYVGVFRVSLSDAGDAFPEKWLRDSGFISQPLEGETTSFEKEKHGQRPACVSVHCGDGRPTKEVVSLSSFFFCRLVA